MENMARSKVIHLQCGRPGFNPWVGKIPWRRERLPTPVFWPREFHGLYSPWGSKESDTTEQFSLRYLTSKMQQRNSLLKFRLLYSREKQTIYKVGKVVSRQNRKQSGSHVLTESLDGCGAERGNVAQNNRRGVGGLPALLRAAFPKLGGPPCPAAGPPSLTWASTLFCCSWSR